MIELYTDATPKSGAWVIVSDKATEYSAWKFAQKHTVNEGEYAALIVGLKECLSRGHNDLKIFADSELMVKQVLGRYKVRKNLIPYHKEVMELLSQCSIGTSIEWISGKENPADCHSRSILWVDKQ